MQGNIRNVHPRGKPLPFGINSDASQVQNSGKGFHFHRVMGCVPTDDEAHSRQGGSYVTVGWIVVLKEDHMPFSSSVLKSDRCTYCYERADIQRCYIVLENCKHHPKISVAEPELCCMS